MKACLGKLGNLIHKNKYHKIAVLSNKILIWYAQNSNGFTYFKLSSKNWA